MGVSVSGGIMIVIVWIGEVRELRGICRAWCRWACDDRSSCLKYRLLSSSVRATVLIDITTPVQLTDIKPLRVRGDSLGTASSVFLSHSFCLYIKCVSLLLLPQRVHSAALPILIIPSQPETSPSLPPQLTRHGRIPKNGPQHRQPLPRPRSPPPLPPLRPQH